MPEISFTFEFKRNLRALAKKYQYDLISSRLLTGWKMETSRVIRYPVSIWLFSIQKGKRSSYPVIYYLKTREKIFLVTIYSKLDQSDISAKRIKEILKKLG